MQSLPFLDCILRGIQRKTGNGWLLRFLSIFLQNTLCTPTSKSAPYWSCIYQPCSFDIESPLWHLSDRSTAQPNRACSPSLMPVLLCQNICRPRRRHNLRFQLSLPLYRHTSHGRTSCTHGCLPHQRRIQACRFRRLKGRVCLCTCPQGSLRMCDCRPKSPLFFYGLGHNPGTKTLPPCAQFCMGNTSLHGLHRGCT